MKPLRLLPLLALLGAAQEDPEDMALHGAYRCVLRPDPAGTLHISQLVSVLGRPLSTDASWVEASGYLLDARGKGRPEPVERGYMTISVNGAQSPSKTEPGWFDLGGAKVQITVVTKGKLSGATAITFRRPTRVGDRYEDGLTLVATHAKHLRWTIAAAPYRMLDAFAADERELQWQLVRWVGGDVKWNPEGTGRFDLHKVEAFNKSVDAARPALAALRADYKKSCQFEPAVEEEFDTI
ncbi:MAG TPA: hypothetical protein VGB48_09685 [Allosphingosinicella sp.]